MAHAGAVRRGWRPAFPSGRHAHDALPHQLPRLSRPVCAGDGRGAPPSFRPPGRYAASTTSERHGGLLPAHRRDIGHRAHHCPPPPQPRLVEPLRAERAPDEKQLPRGGALRLPPFSFGAVARSIRVLSSPYLLSPLLPALQVLNVIVPVLNLLVLTIAALVASRARWWSNLGARELLESAWVALARAFTVHSVLLLTRFVITASDTRSVNMGKLVLGLWLGILVAFMRSSSLRLRIQKKLAVRGQTLLNSASVVAYVGEATRASELVARAEASFRAVPLFSVRPEHLASTEPDDALFALSVPVALSGECDCFIR